MRAQAQLQSASETAASPDGAVAMELAERAARLNRDLATASAERIVEVVLQQEFPGRVALVSSFGADAAVLLHLVAKVDRTTPVLFLDTGKHFLETLTYRDILIDRFRFTDARSLKPSSAELAREDAGGDLWSRQPDRCCALRKVVPLEKALYGFDAWITGRKRYQTSGRAELSVAEIADSRIKINPLANWSEVEVSQAFKDFKLPRHPLFDEGYASIGCAPCTRRVLEGEHGRAGRWAGSEKTECGIHLGFDGAGI